MARSLRYLPPDCPLVEVTCRTIQGRMLLRPSTELNRRVIGVLARASHLYDVGVCAFVFLSNHYHLLLRPGDAARLAAFMNYLNSNIAREIGRLHRWRERFWGRRYRAIAVSFETEAQTARLRYLLTQGCKEGLVASPEEWPGPSSIAALLGDGCVSGIWYDRTAEYWARRRGKSVDRQRFSNTETVTLQPLPCWDDLTDDEAKARIASLLTEIAAETQRMHERARTRPVGRRRILRQNPHSRLPRMARSEAPRFHASRGQVRRMLEAGYRTYQDAYREATAAIRKQLWPVRFPEHGIPPPLVAVASAA